MVIVLLILGGLYILLTGYLVHSLRSRDLPKPNDNKSLSISVIVAARNEDSNIQKLLQALRNQDYPDNLYEIIVVDDHSDDNTLKFLKSSEIDNLTCLSLDKEFGKKAAITKGITAAKGEVILLTDADCQPGPGWVSGMARLFNGKIKGKAINFVIGYSKYLGNKWFQRIRALERDSLFAMTAALANRNIGITCVGENIAYRKSLFDEVGGFTGIDQILSGDDDLFIQKVFQARKGVFAFSYDPHTTMQTGSPESISAVFAQERRRTSKGKFYPLWILIAASPIVLFNLLLVLLFVLSILCLTTYYVLLSAAAVKILMDFLLLSTYYRQTKGKLSFIGFLVLELIHPFYMIFFSIYGFFAQYTWKNRAAGRP